VLGLASLEGLYPNGKRSWSSIERQRKHVACQETSPRQKGLMVRLMGVYVPIQVVVRRNPPPSSVKRTSTGWRCCQNRQNQAVDLVRLMAEHWNVASDVSAVVEFLLEELVEDRKCAMCLYPRSKRRSGCLERKLGHIYRHFRSLSETHVRVC